MKQDIRDVMLANMQVNKTGRIEHEHRLIGVPVKNAYYGEGQVVGLMHGGSLVLMEFDGGPITVIKDLEYVLDEDSTVELSIAVLEKRFGHLRELKNAKPSLVVSAGVAKHAAREVMEAKLRTPSKPTAKAKPEPKPKPISKLKPKLKSAPKNSSMVSSPDKPNVSASRRRVQEMARLGPPANAPTLFGKKPVRKT